MNSRKEIIQKISEHKRIKEKVLTFHTRLTELLSYIGQTT